MTDLVRTSIHSWKAKNPALMQTTTSGSRPASAAVGAQDTSSAFGWRITYAAAAPNVSAE